MASIKMNPLDIALLETRAEVAFLRERAERAEKRLAHLVRMVIAGEEGGGLTPDQLMAVVDQELAEESK